MDSEMLNIRQVCEASDLTRQQLDQWISRGHFKPATTPETGKARLFSIYEAMQICAMAELNRLGLPLSDANRACLYLTGFKDDQAILVVWQGLVGLLPFVERGAPVPEANVTQHHPDGWSYTHPSAPKGYNPDATYSEIVKPHALASMVRDPDKRSMMLVNLDHVEARVKKALAGTDKE